MTAQNVIHASDLFRAQANMAEALHRQHIASNAALATNQARRVLKDALEKLHGKMVYNVDQQRWEVQFGKRDAFFPEGVVLQHLRAMEERRTAVSKPHPVRKSA
jgi:hypothetical protein